jgi:uncharacterized protein
MTSPALMSPLTSVKWTAGNFARVRDNRGMNTHLAKNMAEIRRLCERFEVVKLELFGSATGSDFDPNRSDFDFIATFADKRPGSRYGFRFLEFEEQLGKILDRPVDVIGDQPFSNPYFARTVNESRQTIYESKRSKAVA